MTQICKCFNILCMHLCQVSWSSCCVHGEVVMVNEKFGIRLTDVISPGERIKRLQK